MFGTTLDRRKLGTLLALALLAGCKVIPKAGPDQPPPPENPNANVLPTDQARHRVAHLADQARSHLDVFGSDAENLKASVDFVLNRRS